MNIPSCIGRIISISHLFYIFYQLIIEPENSLQKIEKHFEKLEFLEYSQKILSLQILSGFGFALIGVFIVKLNFTKYLIAFAYCLECYLNYSDFNFHWILDLGLVIMFLLIFSPGKEVSPFHDLQYDYIKGISNCQKITRLN